MAVGIGGGAAGWSVSRDCGGGKVRQTNAVGAGAGPLEPLPWKEGHRIPRKQDKLRQNRRGSSSQQVAIFRPFFRFALAGPRMVPPNVSGNMNETYNLTGGFQRFHHFAACPLDLADSHTFSTLPWAIRIVLRTIENDFRENF